MKTTDPSLDIVRQFFLEENPNPERVGCPPEETLKAAAENRLPVDDPARLHMADCSECFAEYRGYRLDWETKQAAKRRFIGWAVAAGLLIGVAGGAFALRHHFGPKQGPEQMAINAPIGGKTKPPIGGLEPYQVNPPIVTPAPERKPEVPKAPKRGLHPDGGHPNAHDQSVHDVLDLSPGDPAQRQRQRILRLRAAELNLSLLLPPSSEPGNYQVSLTQDAAGQKVLASTAGDAVTRHGRVSLKVHLPLQSIAPGGYFLSVAQSGSFEKNNPGQNNPGQDPPVQNTPGQNNAGKNNATQGQGIYDVQVVPR